MLASCARPAAGPPEGQAALADARDDARQGQADDEGRAEVLRLLSAWAERRNACDPAGLLALYAEGAGIMTYDAAQGRDRLVTRDEYAALLPGKAEGWRRRGRAVSLQGAPRVSLRSGVATVEFDLLVREGERRATGRYAILAQPIGGTWRITREVYAQQE